MKEKGLFVVFMILLSFVVSVIIAMTIVYLLLIGSAFFSVILFLGDAR